VAALYPTRTAPSYTTSWDTIQIGASSGSVPPSSIPNNRVSRTSTLGGRPSHGAGGGA
jgi:hypothetical protein